jgi:hypothetical protein
MFSRDLGLSANVIGGGGGYERKKAYRGENVYKCKRVKCIQKGKNEMQKGRVHEE